MFTLNSSNPGRPTINIEPNEADEVFVSAGEHWNRHHLINGLVYGLCSTGGNKLIVPIDTGLSTRLYLHPRSKITLVLPITTAIFGTRIGTEDNKPPAKPHLATTKNGKPEYVTPFIRRGRIKERLLNSKHTFMKRASLMEDALNKYRFNRNIERYLGSLAGIEKMFGMHSVIVYEKNTNYYLRKQVMRVGDAVPQFTSERVEITTSNWTNLNILLQEHIIQRSES